MERRFRKSRHTKRPGENGDKRRGERGKGGMEEGITRDEEEEME